jgi:hypothetical protein
MPKNEQSGGRAERRKQSSSEVFVPGGGSSGEVLSQNWMNVRGRILRFVQNHGKEAWRGKNGYGVR